MDEAFTVVTIYTCSLLFGRLIFVWILLDLLVSYSQSGIILASLLMSGDVLLLYSIKYYLTQSEVGARMVGAVGRATPMDTLYGLR